MAGATRYGSFHAGRDEGAGCQGKPTRLAKFIEKRVLELRPRKPQNQIATEAGYTNPNMISMLKSGNTKLALDRGPAAARALEYDPRQHRLGKHQLDGVTASAELLHLRNRLQFAPGPASPHMPGCLPHRSKARPFPVTRHC